MLLTLYFGGHSLTSFTLANVSQFVAFIAPFVTSAHVFLRHPGRNMETRWLVQSCVSVTKVTVKCYWRASNRHQHRCCVEHDPADHMCCLQRPTPTRNDSFQLNRNDLSPAMTCRPSQLIPHIASGPLAFIPQCFFSFSGFHSLLFLKLNAQLTSAVVDFDCFS